MADSGVQSKALVKSLQQLSMSGAIRADQAEEIAVRAHEASAERWVSPFLREVREHTRAYADALCPAPDPDQQCKPQGGKENSST